VEDKHGALNVAVEEEVEEQSRPRWPGHIQRSSLRTTQLSQCHRQRFEASINWLTSTPGSRALFEFHVVERLVDMIGVMKGQYQKLLKRSTQAAAGAKQQGSKGKEGEASKIQQHNLNHLQHS
jgi:hypothetical protein